MVGVAGVYQLSRFNALMINYRHATEASATATESFGSVMREQEKYGQSLEARINRMKTAWYGFADAMGNTIVYDALVVGTDALEGMTTSASEANNISKLLGTTITLVSTAVLMSNNTFKAWSASLVDSQIKTIGVTGANGLLSKSLIAVRDSALGASAGLKSFLVATGVGILITGVVTAIGYLIKKRSEMIQQNEEFEATLEKNKLALTDNKEHVDKLIASYTSLSEAKANGVLSTEQEQELLDVQNKLAEQYPALVESIDANGNAHLVSADKVDEKTKSVLALIEKEKELQRLEAEKTFEDVGDDLKGKRKERDRLESNIKGFKANNANPKHIAELELQLLKLDDEIANITGKIASNVMEVSDAFVDVGQDIESVVDNDINKALTGLDFSNLKPEELAEFSKKLAEIRVGLSEAFLAKDEDGFVKYREQLNNLINSVGVSSDEIAVNVLSFEELTKASEETGNALQFVDTSMENFGNTTANTTGLLDGLTDKLNELSTVEEKLAGASQASVDATNDLMFMYGELSNRLAGHSQEELQALLTKENLTNEEKVLADAMRQREAVINDLNTLYPQYQSYQEDELALSEQQREAIEAESQANEALIEAYKLASEGKLTEEQKQTMYQVQGTKARIEAIKTEMKALDTLRGQLQATYDKIMNSKELQTDENAGRGAMRAGYLLGQIDNKYDNLFGDLSGEISELDGLSSSLGGVVSSVKEVGSSTKSASKSGEDANKTTSQSVYITDAYAQKMEQLNLAIEKAQHNQAKYPKYTSQYRKYLQDEINLQKQKLNLINEQTKALNNQIKSGKIKQTGNITIDSGTSTSGTTSTSTKTSTISSGGAWTGRLTSSQGYRTLFGKREYHRGIDIASPKGTKLLANIAGKIIASGNASKNGYHSSYGNIVVVQDSNGLKHLYAHLDKAVAKIGSTVNKGDYLGNIGSTGNSTGSHLHYEVRNKNGGLESASAYAKEARSGKMTRTTTTTTTSKTSSGVVSTGQDAIDQAKSNVIDLQIEALNQEKILAELEKSKVESYLAWYDFKRDNYDANINHEVAKLKTLNTESMRYNKTLDLMKNYMQQKQTVNNQELVYIEGLIAKGGLSAEIMDMLKQRQLELKTAIHELNDEMQKFNLEQITEKYEDYYDTVKDNISIEEAKTEHLDALSDKYVESLRKIKMSYEDNARAVANHIAVLEELVKTNKVSGENLKETIDQINDLKVELEELYTQINDKKYEIVVSVNNRVNDVIDDLQYKLDRSELIQGMYTEGSELWQKEQATQLELLENIREAYKAQRLILALEMEKADLSAERERELLEELEEIDLAYVQTEASIRDLMTAMEESQNPLKNDIADAYIEAYKAYIQEIEEEHMKLLDEQAKAEEEAYNKRKEMLEDEMELFKKNVDEKLELIRKQEAERTYQDELDELEDERSTIQNKINLLSMDNSYEAKKQMKELLEELEAIDKEIAEHRHDRDIELQEEALNGLLEKKEEEINIQQEANDKAYDDTVQRLEDEREYWETHYRDLANDERKFAQIREDILAGHFDKVNAEFQGFVDRLIATMPKLENTLNGTMIAVGTTIRQNVIDQLKKAMDMVFNYQNGTSGSASGGYNDKEFTDKFDPNVNKPQINESTSPTYKDENIAENMGDVKVIVAKYMNDVLANRETNQVRASNIREKGHALAKEGRKEGGTIPSNMDFYEATKDLTTADKMLIKQYLMENAKKLFMSEYLQMELLKWGASLDTGGYLNFGKRTGGLDGKGGKALIAHDGEVMLNKVQTDRLLDNIEVSDTLLSKIANITATFSNLLTNMTPNLVGGGNITVNFGDVHEATQEQAENFAKQFINRINTRRGGF